MENNDLPISGFENLSALERTLQGKREAIFIHDYETGKILDVNDFMLFMYGFSRDEVVHLAIEDIFTGQAPHTVEEAYENLRKVRETGEITFEWHDRRKNGQFFWTENVMRVVRIGGIKCIAVISTDITERKKKQLKLQGQIREHAREVIELNEKLTLANEELRIINDELESYKGQLEELVAIRTRELKYKTRLEELVSNTSSHFFNLSPEQIDNHIEKSLHDLCDFLEMDTGLLFEISYNEYQYRPTHIWQRKTDIPIEKNRQVPLHEIDAWVEKARQSNAYLVDSIREFPENSFLKTLFTQTGSSSIMLLPILYLGNVVGFTALFSGVPGRRWTSEETALIRVIGEIFVTAIKRKSSEKILIESERNYREIFNATSEAIFILDAKNGDLIDANQAALDLFGISHEEFMGSTNGEPLMTDLGFNQGTFKDFIGHAMAHQVAVFEWLAVRKSGETFWAEVSLKSSEIGGDWRVITVIRDISERKRNEETIRQREERFRSILQYLTDIIWIIDENLNVIYESPSSSQVLGYEPGTIIGKRSLELVHPDDLDIVRKDLGEVFEKKNDFLPTEFRVRHQSGHWISLEAIANNMLDHPAIQGIIITSRDVTERHRVENALKISEAKFRNIFNNSSDAIIIVSSSYSILEVNEVFLKITGFSASEIHNLKLTDVITDSYLPLFVDHFVRFFQHENLPVMECEINCKSKQPLPVEINSKLIDFEGRPALLSIIRDITDRRLMENRILDTIISTEEREREKFARNLHDELGPLLSSIRMYINSLSAGMELQKYEFIIDQLKKILTDAITSTKELSNDLSPHVLANYGLLAALEWFIKQIGPHIRISFETNLREERFASSMELSIYRIIKELINNTLKHSRANTITIRLHRVMHSLRLEYSDNGVGFPANRLEKIEFMGMGMSNIMSRCRSINALSKFYNHAPNGMSFEMEVQIS
jgi:PAS domain S-box-containing protein